MKFQTMLVFVFGIGAVLLFLESYILAAWSIGGGIGAALGNYTGRNAVFAEVADNGNGGGE